MRPGQVAAFGFYHDFEAYLDQFIKALSKAIEVFLPFIPSLAVWIEPFYKRFPKEINNETLYRYMAEKIQIILPETDKIFIQPSLFSCDRLQYLASTEPGRCSNILWGMHFEIIFLNRLKHNSSTYMCNNMRLLSDRSKFDILKLLAGRRYYSGELAKELNLTTSTIAYHMQALLNARFVTVDKRSYRTYYELNQGRHMRIFGSGPGVISFLNDGCPLLEPLPKSAIASPFWRGCDYIIYAAGMGVY